MLLFSYLFALCTSKGSEKITRLEGSIDAYTLGSMVDSWQKNGSSNPLTAENSTCRRFVFFVDGQESTAINKQKDGYLNAKSH